MFTGFLTRAAHIGSIIEISGNEKIPNGIKEIGDLRNIEECVSGISGRIPNLENQEAIFGRIKIVNIGNEIEEKDTN